VAQTAALAPTWVLKRLTQSFRQVADFALGLTMTDVSRGERLQIMLSDPELRALDDWRFSRRMPSSASAVRELLKRGLAADGFETATSGSKSQSYGVIDSKGVEDEVAGG